MRPVVFSLVIVSALASEGPEGSSGFDDLIEVLADLTEAVADVTVGLRTLRSDVSELSRKLGVSPCGVA